MVRTILHTLVAGTEIHLEEGPLDPVARFAPEAPLRLD